MLDMLPAGDSNDDPDKQLLSDSLRQEITAVMEVLNFREKEIIAAYFGLNGSSQMNLEEIAEYLDLTRERVRQIKERAIRRLRKATNNKHLKSYL